MFIVHSIPGSPFGRSVFAALEEKQAPYVLRAIVPGTLREPAHLAIHPFGRIPVLEHDGFTLYETQAILRYLDRVLPAPAMTPADPRAAARMDQIMNISDWYLFQGVANVIGFQRIVGPRLMGLTPDEAVIAAAMPKAETVFGALSDCLGDQLWMAGAALTLADLAVAPLMDFLAATPEWGALTRGRDNLVRWLDRMNARPSMQATTWEKIAALAA